MLFYSDRFRVSFLRECNLEMALMTVYTPFWFKLEKVEIVRESSSKEVICCRVYANLKKEPPPICSILYRIVVYSNILKVKCFKCWYFPANSTYKLSYDRL